MFAVQTTGEPGNLTAGSIVKVAQNPVRATFTMSHICGSRGGVLEPGEIPVER